MRDQTRARVRLYLGAQALSTFGTSSIWLTVALWIRDLTGDNGAAALAFFFYLTPALLSPLAGVLVDRSDVKRMLVFWNVVGAVTALGILGAGYGLGHVAIYGVLLLYGGVATVLAPAQSVLLVAICPASDLPAANATLRTCQSALKIVAPVAGAGVFSALGPAPAVVLDAATFVLAALIVALVAKDASTPDRQPRNAERSIVRELAVGATALRSNARLWGITLASSFYMLFAGLNEAAIWAVVTESLGLSAAFIGVVQFAAGLGSVVGGIAAAPLLKRCDLLVAFSVAMVAFALGNALLLVPHAPVVLVGGACIGVSQSVALVAAIAAVQVHSDTSVQGRVFGAFELLATGPQILSVAAGATLLSVIGFRPLLLVGLVAGCSIAVAVYGQSRQLDLSPNTEESR